MFYISRYAINLVSGRPQDGALALSTIVPADKAAILPTSIPFPDGVVVPFALEAVACALFVQTPGTAMSGVSTPALSLPYPLLYPATLGRTMVIYGGCSSVGSTTTQLAAIAGVEVISITSPRLAGRGGRLNIATMHSYTMSLKKCAIVAATLLVSSTLSPRPRRTRAVLNRCPSLVEDVQFVSIHHRRAFRRTCRRV